MYLGTCGSIKAYLVNNTPKKLLKHKYLQDLSHLLTKEIDPILLSFPKLLATITKKDSYKLSNCHMFHLLKILFLIFLNNIIL